MRPPLAAVLLVTLVAGCGREQAPAGASLPGGWRLQTDGGMTPAQVQQSTRGATARDALAKALQSELLAAIGAQGARAALGVCKVRAPEIAAAVGKEQGVRIGRTALRRRSEANQPPAWVAPLLHPGIPTAMLTAGPNGELGMVSPILTQALCVQCHGQPDQLAEGVAAALQEQYPHDQATGFAPGDVRGWFWIEVPATKGP